MTAALDCQFATTLTNVFDTQVTPYIHFLKVEYNFIITNHQFHYTKEMPFAKKNIL